MADKKQAYVVADYVRDFVTQCRERILVLEAEVRDVYYRIDFPGDPKQREIAARIYTQEMGPFSTSVAASLASVRSKFATFEGYANFLEDLEKLDKKGTLRTDAASGVIERIRDELEAWDKKFNGIDRRFRRELTQKVETINKEIKFGWNQEVGKPQWDTTKNWTLKVDTVLKKMGDQLDLVKENAKNIYHQISPDGTFTKELQAKFTKIMKPITNKLEALIDRYDNLEKSVKDIPRHEVVVGTRNYHRIMDVVENWRKDCGELNASIENALRDISAPKIEEPKLEVYPPGRDAHSAPTELYSSLEPFEDSGVDYDIDALTK